MIRAIEPAALAEAEAAARRAHESGFEAHTQPPLQLVDLYQLEKMSYRQGWRWGVFCGACLAVACAVTAALVMGLVA